MEKLEIVVSDRIRLCEIELTDAEDIFTTIDTQREYLGKWLPFVEMTRSVDFSRDFIKSVLDAPLESRNFNFTIRYDGCFVGLAGFRDTDYFNRKTEIGYWLSQPFQKMGIVTESVLALLGYAFTEMDMNRVTIKCGVGNIPSRNIPVRLNFTLEGVERAGELFPDGHFIDLEVYSMLKSEWNFRGRAEVLSGKGLK